MFSQNFRVRRNLWRDWINYLRRGGQWEKGTRCFITQLRTVSSLLVIYHSVIEQLGPEGLLCARCYTRLGKHSRTRQRPYPKERSGCHLADQTRAEIQKSCPAHGHQLLVSSGLVRKLGLGLSQCIRGWCVKSWDRVSQPWHSFISPLPSPCHSHTINYLGKALLLEMEKMKLN